MGHIFPRMSKAPRVWSYISDIEGNLTYWNRFLSLSNLLERREDGTISLDASAGFIFGGDSVDKGNGDIRVVRDLLQLKKDYPDRVHLLVGNRDANKLRFASELVSAETLSAPYWTPADKRTTYDQFLEKHSLTDSKISRIRWMLTETMGSDTTFNFRKEELEQLGKDNSDESVLQSFLDSIDPSGEDNFMYQYLQNGCLIVRVGNTLIIHGGLSSRNIGRVPGDDTVYGVDTWETKLNAWMQSQVEEYAQQPTWTELPDEKTERGKRGGDGLMDYGVPGGNDNRTVVYCSFLSDGNASEISKECADYLKENGINRVIVGHTPHGDCPTVIQTEGVQIFLCDTSYSDMSQPDNRGVAVSELLFTQEDVEVHGILKDSRNIQYKLNMPTDAASPDSLVGRSIPSGHWVKAKLAEPPADGKDFMLCRGKGYSLDIQWMSEAEIKGNIGSSL